jgi:hypothetical protein
LRALLLAVLRLLAVTLVAVAGLRALLLAILRLLTVTLLAVGLLAVRLAGARLGLLLAVRLLAWCLGLLGVTLPVRARAALLAVGPLLAVRLLLPVGLLGVL